MMNDRRAPGQVGEEHPGLCKRCTHVQVIISARGSRFYLCQLSLTDPAFPRYPRIPVLECSGFAPAPGDRH